MNNILQINTDPYNIYITIIVKTKLSGKILIIGLNIFLSILIGSILFFGNIEKSSILPAFIAIILLYILPIKYLLWNFWGKENIIINTKSISYSFDYGIVKPNLTTKKIDKLELFFEVGEKNKDQEKGQLIFYNYRNEDHLPHVLYKTNVLLKKNEVKEIAEKIHQLYIYEQNENFGFVKFSDN